MVFVSKTHVNRVFFGLIAFIIIITLISFTFGTITVTQKIESGFLHQMFTLFNVDAEDNLPTWVSTTLLSVVGIQFVMIAYYRHDLEKHDFFHWLFLGLMFLGISFDEFAHLHEIMIRPLRDTLDTGGLLYYPWIIPAAILTIVVAIIYFKFVWKLAPTPRLVFIAACVIYVSGALGMEAVGGYYFDNFIHAQNFTYDIPYLAMTHIEEFMEMLGTALFLYVGLYYLQMIRAGEYNSQAEPS